MVTIKRFEKNPILRPDKDQSWEAEAVFNGCPIKLGSTVHLLYRAVSLPHYHASAQLRIPISDIGIAESSDGLHFYNRRRFIAPEKDWERFGCEDPRITSFEGMHYIFYTALSSYPFTAEGIKVGVALSENLENIKGKHLVTPFNAKAMALFPERIRGKMCAILTAYTDRPPSKVAVAFFERETDIWDESYWKRWQKTIDSNTIALARREGDHIEVGAPPLKTKQGWLIVYSYIHNYFLPRRLFAIEAVLLSLENPTRIVGRTQGPLLIAEEEYERYGMVPNVIFPSGLLLENDNLRIYYGASDTTCCAAETSLSMLLQKMKLPEKNITFIRLLDKPLIAPKKGHSWESKATYNPAALYEDGRVHLLYRALSNHNTSVFGYAASRDGIHIDERFDEPVYQPREPFEMKLEPKAYSGCEDPRITRIGDTLYVCYTAFDGKHPPRIALTSIGLSQFLKKEWVWAKPVLLSPPDFDNKDACIFPEEVKGGYLIFHRMGDDIDIALVPTLSFDGMTWLEERRWLKPRRGMWDSKKVGIAAPPLKTQNGWILIYHGVSEDDNMYRVGAVLLALEDPTKIIGRTDEPLLEPQAPYEKEGLVSNVVFPCGNVLIGDTIYIYYGGADEVVSVANIAVNTLLETLK